jgi:precorrin-2 dehydrogenase/sirohydrochlorin ferrochelatase
MLPILLDVRGRRSLVVGGGIVGRRKAQAAFAAGAAITLVALEPAPPDWTAGEWKTASYRAEYLDGIALVFAAAPPDVNERVVQDAVQRRIPVNSATDPTAGDFVLPAVVRRGGLTLAVNTSGAAPALARRIREKFEAEFDDSYGTWIELLERLRPIVLERIADPDRRRDLLDEFADWPWLARLRHDGPAATWEKMVEAIH